jgi:hypothetical protein
MFDARRHFNGVFWELFATAVEENVLPNCSGGLREDLEGMNAPGCFFTTVPSIAFIRGTRTLAGDVNDCRLRILSLPLS